MYQHYPTSYHYRRYREKKRIKLLKYLFILILGIIGGYIIHKVATYDYCPIYYNVRCLPNP